MLERIGAISVAHSVGRPDCDDAMPNWRVSRMLMLLMGVAALNVGGEYKNMHHKTK